MQISIEMKNQHDDISLDVDQPSETVSIETMEVSEIVSDDYERLKNKPTLNGVVIVVTCMNLIQQFHNGRNLRINHNIHRKN